MNNTIYIGATDNPKKFHVGMTENNRSPYLRWQDYDFRAKLPYVPKRVEFYSVGFLRDEPIHKYILQDKNITSVKDEEGIRSDEIFRVNANNPAEYLSLKVEEAIRYYKVGIRPIKNYFNPRPHQAWVNNQILSKFDGTKTIIQPLNACARFGKTLGGLYLFKQSELKVMIVASYWLSANESFIKDVQNYYDITSDITVIKPNYQEFEDAIGKGQRVLIDVSLHPDADKVDQDLISALSKMSSFIYIDEADFGAWRPSSRKTANQFINSGINLVCVATGTNIDRALIGENRKIEIPIVVSYLDLIEAKYGKGFLFEPGGFCSDDPQKWMKSLSDIVEISCLNLDASEILVNDLNDLSDEKRPNMVKIFAKRNSHIQREIIRKLLCDDDGDGSDVFGLYASEYGSIEHPAVMMFIPGNKSDVNNLISIGKSIAPHYNWIALHGDDHTNRTAENAVKDLIQNGGGERTVIISCSMGSRSFSVPNIIAVINCKDGGSIGTAVQQASRCFTPGCGKKVGLVVNYSFNSQRTSTFETDLISSAIQSNPKDTNAAIRRVYGLVNFFRKDDEGYLLKLSKADFLEYVTSTDNLENMASATIDKNGLLNSIEIVQHLENIRTHSSTNAEWKGIIEKAKSFINTENETESTSESDTEKKEIRDLIKKVQTIIHTSGNAYYLAPYKSTFKDCLIDIANDPIKDQEYIDLVGISAKIVIDSIYEFLPETFMNLIINRIEKFDTEDKFQNQIASHSDSVFNIDCL